MRTMIDEPMRAEAWGHAARARYEALFSGQALGEAHAALYAGIVASSNVLAHVEHKRISGFFRRSA